MRIGLNGSFWNMEHTGSGQYLGQLVRTLAQRHPEEDLTLFLPRSSVASQATAPEDWQTVALRTPFDAVHENLAKLWFEQVAFPHACRAEGVDLAHVPYFAPPLYPGVPTVATIHDLIPLILPEYRGSRWVQGYMRLVAQAARRAALVLTDSLASAQDIRRLLDVSLERIRVIYLAADAMFHPLTYAECAPTLQRLGVRQPYVLYLGGFDRRKNVTVLLRAWAQAHAQLGDLTLVIAGKLPERDSAFAPDPRIAAQQLGLEDRVHFCGWIVEQDKPALYAGAMLFVFPSQYEGFGLPVLEAISCGTPAIVGAGSSLEEIAGPGGLALPPGDVQGLAATLVELAQSPAWREELSARGRAHASQFSWTETARQTLAAYQEALAMASQP